MYLFTGLLIALALFAGGGLLLSDLVPQVFVDLPHAPISAAPLLLIGVASLGFQVLTRPTAVVRKIDPSLLRSFLRSEGSRL